MTSKHLSSILGHLPAAPGVYQMKNDQGAIIYIGKAKNLRSRVRSYFQTGANLNPKNQKMIREVTDIHYIETNSDLEAYLLETNLIKEHRPPYNILMRDDKFFVYLKITKEDFPRVSIVRQRLKDKAWYFGPKTSRQQVKDTITMLRKLFPIRDCSLTINEKTPGTVEVRHNSRGKLPCMDFHIGMCAGPCTAEITKEGYGLMVEEILQFLKGSYQPILHSLEKEMRSLAAAHKFEQAAKRRDLMHSITRLMEKQQINEARAIESRDVLTYTAEDHLYFFNIFQVRDGRIINQNNIILQDTPQHPTPVAALFREAIAQYYTSATDIPRELYTEVPLDPADLPMVTELLSTLAHHAVAIQHPKRGSAHDLLFLGKKNAISFAKQQHIKWINSGSTTHTQGPIALQEALGLPQPPTRIECYDISHLGGTNTVGSMVVFDNAKPKSSHYRSFTLRTIAEGEIDDFKSMEEVLFRRLRHLTATTAYRLAVLTKAEAALYTTTVPDKHTKVLGYFHGEDIEAIIEVRFLDPTHIALHYHSSDAVLANEMLHHHLLLALFKKYPKAHCYLPAQEGHTGFYRTLGFGAAVNPPDTLDSNKTWLHRRPAKVTTDPSLSTTPDLLVIDGGKGQLSHATSAMERLGLSIPIISLAKREEEVFIPGQSTPVLLTKDNPGVLLLRHARDEAHRFAVLQQSKKHRKKSTASILQDIPGIGKETGKKLLSAFGSVHRIKTLTVDDMSPLVGPVLAKTIHHYFHHSTEE